MPGRFTAPLGPGQHLLRALAHNLIDHRRHRARQHDRHGRITIADLRDYIAHGRTFPNQRANAGP